MTADSLAYHGHFTDLLQESVSANTLEPSIPDSDEIQWNCIEMSLCHTKVYRKAIQSLLYAVEQQNSALLREVECCKNVTMQTSVVAQALLRFLQNVAYFTSALQTRYEGLEQGITYIEQELHTCTQSIAVLEVELVSLKQFATTNLTVKDKELLESLQREVQTIKGLLVQLALRYTAVLASQRTLLTMVESTRVKTASIAERLRGIIF